MTDLLHTLLLPTLFSATPLIIAALGELVVERAGVVNIGIEGMMLAGALAGWAADGASGGGTSMLAAIGAGVALALLFALATLWFATDQIVTGTGINLLAYGSTAMVYRRLPRDLGDHVAGIDKRWLVVAWPILAGMLAWFFARTRAGLGMIAVGEAPEAADSAGLRVNARRLVAIVFGGACAGLAGAYLSTMYNRVFTENMTDGAGFLALALVIFGRWNAWGVAAAGLFFGVIRAAGNALQTHSGFSPLAVQSLEMLPYVVSLLALAGVGGRSRAPGALGRPYLRPA